MSEPTTAPAPALPPAEPLRIGLVSISDRASQGVYEDKGIPALQDWMARALHNPVTWGLRWPSWPPTLAKSPCCWSPDHNARLTSP